MPPPNPLRAFIRASSLHIGAAAAAASLRRDLVRDHGVSAEEIDRAYAVSRITPGTNLLALYAVLGHRLGGWALAARAVAVGVGVPAIIALAMAIAYTHTDSPLLGRLLGGARAGGVAVFIGAAVRLLRPQLQQHRRRGVVFALAMAVASWTAPFSVFTLLLVAGAAGAIVLRPR